MNYSSSDLFAVKVADMKVLTLPKHNSLTNQLQGNIKNSSTKAYRHSIKSGFWLPASLMDLITLARGRNGRKGNSNERRRNVSQPGLGTICCF